MASGIYQIRNLVNGKLYVGSAVRFDRRWSVHTCMLRKQQHHSIALQRAWNKYGPDMFVMEILEVVEPLERDLLIAREQHYIDTMKPTYNCSPTAGSNLGVKLSEESRKKIALAQVGRVYGPRPRWAVEKARAALMGHPVSEETRSKLSVANTGKKYPPRTAEHREKMSLAQKGKPRPYARAPRSQEVRAKMSAARNAWWAIPGNREAHSAMFQGHEVSESARQKISEKLKGRPVWWQQRGFSSLTEAMAARKAS